MFHQNAQSTGVSASYSGSSQGDLFWSYYAGRDAASLPANPNAMAKLAPWVVENTEGGTEAEFLVVLADQADLSGAADFSTRVEKGMYVFDTLREKAYATQKPLLDLLAARGIEHRSFYIINAVWVKGNRDIALTLAGRNEVWRIEGNPMIYNDLPAPSGRSQSNSPSAIESNITYVRAPEVWALGHTGEGIVVGGQDTGYQWDHPALKGKYRGWNGSFANHDYNWHDSIHSGGGVCGPNSPVPCDDYGHGTHTMGTVLGDDGAGNQIGMAPGANWIGCRNMDQGAGTPATYLECFEFFLAPYPVGGSPAQGDPSKAPDVTNNSWGCPTSEGCSWNTLQAAVEAQRAAGIMTVVSAGNAGSSCSTVQDPPAIYDASYSVGALNKGTDTIASFSSRGPVTMDGSNRRKPDISAPGTNIRSSVPGGGYEGGWSGTSMAGPHIAGAVALLWSARLELKNQVDSTEYVLGQSAAHISSSDCSSSGWPNNVFGYGRLDVRAAIDQETPTMPPTPTPTETPIPPPVITNITRNEVTGDIMISWISSCDVDIYYAVNMQSTFTLAQSGVSGGSWTDDGIRTGGHPNGASERYYKIACAGTSQYASDAVGMFRYSLAAGYSLICLPLIPYNSDIDVVFGTQLTEGSPITGDRIYTQEPNYGDAIKYGYLSSSYHEWRGTLDEASIVKEKGYLIQIGAGHTRLTQYIVGKVPSANVGMPEFEVGYNLIGNVWPVDVSFDASNLKESGANEGTAMTGDRIYSQSNSGYAGSLDYSWLSSSDGLWYGTLTGFARGYGCWYRINSNKSPFSWTNMKPYSEPPY